MLGNHKLVCLVVSLLFSSTKIHYYIIAKIREYKSNYQFLLVLYKTRQHFQNVSHDWLCLWPIMFIVVNFDIEHWYGTLFNYSSFVRTSKPQTFSVLHIQTFGPQNSSCFQWETDPSGFDYWPYIFTLLSTKSGSWCLVSIMLKMNWLGVKSWSRLHIW